MPLTLITIPDDYPEVPDFTVVRGLLKEVLDETTMLFNGDPPLGVKPVECFNHFVPICDTSGLPGNYRIGLTAKGWNYCAIVFELSHELAHVFFHPLRSGAVIESLACAASFEILKRMSIRWSSCSAAQYSTYAPKFLEYQKSFINREISTFPGTVKQALDHEDWRWLRLVGANMKITLEIEAEIPDGAPEKRGPRRRALRRTELEVANRICKWIESIQAIL